MKLRQLQWDAENTDAMSAVVDASPWAGVAGLRDTLGQAHLWELTRDNTRVLLAVRGVQCENGRVLDVVGMRSLGDRCRAGDLGPAFEQLARECYPNVDLLSMQTRRPHLVRACERQGWTMAATTVTKKLRLQ